MFFFLIFYFSFFHIFNISFFLFLIFSIFFISSFLHFFIFLSFSFIFFDFVGCSKSDFFLGPSPRDGPQNCFFYIRTVKRNRNQIEAHFLLTVLMTKINCCSHLGRGGTPSGPLFLFPLFSPVFCFFVFLFFLAFYFFMFSHFSHFSFISSFFNFFNVFHFSFFLKKKVSFLFSCISFKYALLLALVAECNCFFRSRCSMEMLCLDDIGQDSWDWVGAPAWETACFSTPQSGVEAPRLLKRSLPRLYYCCCFRDCLMDVCDHKASAMQRQSLSSSPV